MEETRSSPMPTLPPPPKSGGWLSTRAQFNWLVASMECLMSSIADLSAKVAEFDTKVEALIAAVAAAKSNPGTTLSAADQTALDSAVQALSTEEANVAAATPAPATPPPPPAA